MLYLDSHSVTQLLNDALSLKLSEIAFKLHATGQVDQPLRTIVRGAEQQLMGVMPAYIKSGPYQGFGLKSVVVKLGEAAKGPSHRVGFGLCHRVAGTSPGFTPRHTRHRVASTCSRVGHAKRKANQARFNLGP